MLLRQGPRVRTFGRLKPYLPSFDIPVSEALWTVYLPAGKKYSAGRGEFSPVVVTDPPGNVTYQFWYDDSGKLLRWGAPSMPIMFVTSSKANVEKMRRTF